MNYAIRSGVSITAGYAIRQSARLLRSVPKSSDRDDLLSLQERLQSKIRIISPAIDMIELIAARGNTSLESAVSLTKALRQEIQSLGQRLADAAMAEEAAKRQGPQLNSRQQNELEIKLIINATKKVLARIEDAIPLINLAITTSGANLSTTLPSTVSPSRLLQASTFLTAGDTQYAMSPDQAVQVGPTFTLSLYMLFAGNVRPQDEDGIRETTWKEVMHKARVKLHRAPISPLVEPSSTQNHGPDITVPSVEYAADHHFPGAARSDEFSYELLIIEDLDDDRVHDFDGTELRPGPYEDVKLAGVRETVPVYQVSKIFYADTGKVLNIGSEGEANNPVLLLKRDLRAAPPRRMIHKEADAFEEQVDSEDDHVIEQPVSGFKDVHARSSSGPWCLPPGLDPEWLAFEVFVEPSEISDDEEEVSTSGPPSPTPSQRPQSPSADPQLNSSLSAFNLDDPSQSTTVSPQIQPPPPWVNAIRTSLSLLELLLRLTSLQQFQQQSHLSITDELLNFFLEESATTGAGGDESYRQRLRSDARRRVGWDPYDESPVKRRGEEYQYGNGGDGYSPRWDDEGENEFFLRGSRGGSASPGRRAPPLPPDARTRSMTRDSLEGSLSPSPSPSLPQAKEKGRWAYLRREREGGSRKGSPLRPRTSVSDEGIGTSPGTSRLEGHGGD